jgi:transcriptional regulator
MKRYPPEIFSSEDLPEAVAMAEEVKFASIHPLDGGRCDAVFAPFVSRRTNGSTVFLGHLVRSNPLLEMLSSDVLPCRLVFQAADGYISPSVYAEKPKSGKVVPTWNYVACQFMGTLEKVPDLELTDLLAYQVSIFEQAQGSDWKLEDAPADFLEHMASGIFGIRFTPERCQIHKKISQNRPVDQRAVIAWTKTLNTPFKSLAHWMEDSDDD